MIQSKTNYQHMHPVDLLRQGMRGDKTAMRYLIMLQQAGRGLRIYPEGRKRIKDDGVYGIHLSLKHECVILRYGRPKVPIIINEDVAMTLVPGLISYLATAITRRLKKGMSVNGAIDAMNRNATPEFECSLDSDAKTATVIWCIRPQYGDCWILPPDRAMRLIEYTLELSRTFSWAFTLSDRQAVSLEFLRGLELNDDQ
ncbi:hypothetical protein N9B39_03045 [bacterium]|nr:hypothetical protein [bacterium]